jgi:hypothetical protein
MVDSVKQKIYLLDPEHFFDDFISDPLFSA